MLFNHLDRDKREKVNIEDLSKEMKGASGEHLKLTKKDWKDTTDKFNQIDTNNKGYIDF